MSRQRIEQWLVGGRVGGAQVIQRLHQAVAEVMGPQPVGDGMGEVGVVGPDHPVGQGFAAVILVGEPDRFGTQSPCGNEFARARVLEVFAWLGHNTDRPC